MEVATVVLQLYVYVVSSIELHAHTCVHVCVCISVHKCSKCFMYVLYIKMLLSDKTNALIIQCMNLFAQPYLVVMDSLS